MPAKRLALLRIVAVCLAIGPLPVLAQMTNGALEGRITDEAGRPVAGALIEVRGPALQAFLGSATDLGGDYKFPFVPAGRGYEVKVEASGYATVLRRGVDVPLGVTVSLPFTLGPGSTELVVTAPAPTVDIKSASSGSSISSTMIAAIPLQRDAKEIPFLAPMAVDAGPSTPNDPSIAGSTGAENNYLINGVDVTDARYGTDGAYLNFDFIQEVQVLTGGLPPEYGAAMGGVVNAITASGGNEFHGSLFAYYWSDETQAESLIYPYYFNLFGNGGYQKYDVGASLGGYFVKDKLWFYAAYDYNSTKQYTDYPAGPQYGSPYLYLNGAPAQSCFAGQHFTNHSSINPMVAFKLTWNVSPNQKLSFSAFGNDGRDHFQGHPLALDPVCTIADVKESMAHWALQWNATWTPRFFTEVDLGYRHRTQEFDMPAAARDNWYCGYIFGYFGAYPRNQTVPPASISGIRTDLGSNYQASLGMGYYATIPKDDSRQARVKFTNLLGGAGRHELSYGLQYQKDDYTPEFNESGPDTLVSPSIHQQAIGGVSVNWFPAAMGGLPPGPHGEQYIYRAIDKFTPRQRPNTERYTVAWVNDDWSLTDHFTLKLGLRYDEETLRGDLTGLSLRLTDNWAPRVGFTWDVKHDGRSKLYGFYGRYFERVPLEVAVDGLNWSITGYEYFYDPRLTVWTGLSYIYGSRYYIQGQLLPPATQLTPASAAAYSHNLKAPYTDEWVFGYDYQLKPDLTLGVRAVYRELGRALEDISIDGGSSYIIANPDVWTGVPAVDLENPKEVIFLPEPVRRYEALAFTLDKRYGDNWQLSASFVYSKLRGNHEGAANNDYLYGQLMPNLTVSFDLPEFMVNGYGALPLDRTYVLKAYGSYVFREIPLMLSGVFFLQSGTPLSIQTQTEWATGAVLFDQPRGEAGRTPWTWTLDLGVEYIFKLPMKSNLGIRLDVFNVTNNQVATQYYQAAYYQYEPGGKKYANPLYGKPWAHQEPRTARFALRWTF